MLRTAPKKVDATGDFDVNAGFCVEIAGIDLFIHNTGVAYLAEEEALIVADLHLEKGSSYAAKQIFLPPYDTTATLNNLSIAINALEPRKVIALGDSFHDEDGPNRLNDADRSHLNALVHSADWVWISGNHDPILPETLGGTFTDEITLCGLTLRHDPQVDGTAEIAGHLHPSAKVRGRGRSVRKRCFIANSERMIMPAFGRFTGGLNVTDEAFDDFFPAKDYHAYMMGDDRLYPIAAKSCLAG